jgi:hypothetical protein
MPAPVLRPDLTEYRPYVEMLKDALNEDGIHAMTLTDAVKIAIEKAVSSYHPDIEIKRKRKIYQTLLF